VIGREDHRGRPETYTHSSWRGPNLCPYLVYGEVVTPLNLQEHENWPVHGRWVVAMTISINECRCSPRPDENLSALAGASTPWIGSRWRARNGCSILTILPKTSDVAISSSGSSTRTDANSLGDSQSTYAPTRITLLQFGTGLQTLSKEFSCLSLGVCDERSSLKASVSGVKGALSMTTDRERGGLRGQSRTMLLSPAPTVSEVRYPWDRS